jgi:NADPH2:quinone reductase
MHRRSVRAGHRRGIAQGRRAWHRHIVEVAFDANVSIDFEVLSSGGSIGAYATGRWTPSIPFWPLVFQNTRVRFLGSDDFPN